MIPYGNVIAVAAGIALVTGMWGYNKWRSNQIDSLRIENAQLQEANRRIAAAAPIIKKAAEDVARIERAAKQASEGNTDETSLDDWLADFLDRLRRSAGD